jgi:DNA-binding MarR family transcriptional regulator
MMIRVEAVLARVRIVSRPESRAVDAADTATEPLRADLGWLLTRALQAYRPLASHALEVLPGGLRGYQLLAVAMSGCANNQVEAGRHLGIDRTGMVHLVDVLEAAGLVERRPDPADRRARLLVITPAGRRAFTDAQDRLAAAETHLLSALSIPEQSTLMNALERVAAAAQSAAQSAAPCDPAAPDAACPDAAPPVSR